MQRKSPTEACAKAEFLRIAVEAQEDTAMWHREMRLYMLGAEKSAAAGKAFWARKDLDHATHAQGKAAGAAKLARECMGLED